MKKVIFLNAGHSELDPGANIPNNRFENESQLNMVIRDFLVPELQEQGFDVILIPDDKNLNGSYSWVNERAFNINDGLALSIHNNCCRQEGAETYYVSFSNSSRVIAQKLIDEFCKETRINNRGARPDSITRFGELSWLRETNAWATLIECGFMDSAKDMEYIINNIPEVAKAICKGVCRIYNIPYIDCGKEESIEEISNNSKAIKEILQVLVKYKFIK